MDRSSLASSKSLFILAASRLVRKFDASKQIKLLPSGAVRLENVELETSLLWSRDLPGQLKFAWLGSLQIDLGLFSDPSQSPTAVVLSDLYVLVTDPSAPAASTADERNTITEEGADAVLALRLVLFGIVNRIKILLTTGVPPSVQAFESNVLSLLDFTVHNVHVRMEDRATGLESAVPFQYTLGAVMETLTMNTDDSAAAGHGSVSKVGEMNGFALYFCEDMMLHETEEGDDVAFFLDAMLEGVFSPPFSLPLLMEKMNAKFVAKLDSNARAVDLDVQIDEVKFNVVNEQFRYFKALQQSFSCSISAWFTHLFADFATEDFGGGQLLLPGAPLAAVPSGDGAEEMKDATASPAAAAITTGILTVTVGEAVNLPASRAEVVSDLNDAFVVLELGHSPAKHCTKVCPKTMHPLWAESFPLVVKDASSIKEPTLKLACLDHNLVTDNVIGTTELDLTTVFASPHLAIHKQVLALEGPNCSPHPITGTRLTVYVSFLPDADEAPAGGELPIVHPDFALAEFADTHTVHATVGDAVLVDAPVPTLTTAVTVGQLGLDLLALPEQVGDIAEEDYASLKLLSLDLRGVAVQVVQQGPTQTATVTIASTEAAPVGQDALAVSALPVTLSVSSTNGAGRVFSLSHEDTLLANVDAGVVAGVLAQMVPADAGLVVRNSPLLAEVLQAVFAALGHPGVVFRTGDTSAVRDTAKPPPAAAGGLLASGSRPGGAEALAKQRQLVLMKRELTMEKRDYRNAEERRDLQAQVEGANAATAAQEEEVARLVQIQDGMAAQIQQLQADKKALESQLAEQTHKAFRLEEELEQATLQVDFLARENAKQREALTSAEDEDKTHKAVVDFLETEADLMRKRLEAAENLLIRRTDPTIGELREEVELLTSEKQELTKVHNELLANFGQLDETRATLEGEKDDLLAEKNMMRGWLYRFQQQMATLKRMNPYVFNRLVVEPLVTEVDHEHKVAAAPQESKQAPSGEEEESPERASWAVPRP